MVHGLVHATAYEKPSKCQEMSKPKRLGRAGAVRGNSVHQYSRAGPSLERVHDICVVLAAGDLHVTNRTVSAASVRQ